jgi:D-alanyl-D-alanine carboxypeptidase/D-alanyl-D-alanine-endopeptidase (penicillin-binding protein 4)
MHKFLFLFFSFGFFFSLTIDDNNLALLKSEINKLKSSSDLERGMLGVYLYDIKNDSVLIDYNGNTGLVPASSLKTVTTAIALSQLGADYKYETKLEYDGYLDTAKGILNGNLYITGSGDPSLGSKYFVTKDDSANSFMEKWIAILKSKNIKSVTGSIIADASCFENEPTPVTWIWGDMGNYYGAGAMGLNYRDNLYTLFFNSTDTGEDAKIVKTNPAIKNLQIVNNVKCSGSGDNCFIYGAPHSNIRYAEGKIPPNKTNFDVDGSMPDASLYCAYEFDSLLKQAGISIKKQHTTVRELQLHSQYKKADRKKLASHFSKPLSEIVYWTNKKSVNLFAEALLKTVSLKQSGLGTLNSGTALLQTLLANKGVDTKGLYLNDGSGLSRWNSISAKQLAQVMKFMTKEKTFNSFFNSLPDQGNNIYAKSGYITRVRSYTGYVKKPSGDLLAFAIIANNYDCSPSQMRKKIETIMDLMGALK